MNDKINSMDLYHSQKKVSFAVRTMEVIDRELGGISDQPHRHNYYTVIWSYTATGRHIIDFKEYAIEPQNIFFVSPGQVHQMITDPNPSGLVILFTPEFLQKNSIREDFISNLKLFRGSDGNPPMEINNTMKQRLDMFARGMVEAFDSDSDMRNESFGSYLKLFLIECNGHCSLNLGTNTQKVEVKRSLVQQFKTIVENRFRQWHQVKEYAEELNVTPSYLNDVIKLSIGESAKDFIQCRLILEAKRMSVFTDKSIKEIGFDLGFEDPSHFSKFFKSFTGQTIMEFKDITIS
jgi:AraC family transcriptional regulator, transcriptional activator of pobA